MKMYPETARLSEAPPRLPHSGAVFKLIYLRQIFIKMDGSGAIRKYMLCIFSTSEIKLKICYVNT